MRVRAAIKNKPNIHHFEIKAHEDARSILQLVPMDKKINTLTPEQGAIYFELIDASLRVKQREHMFSLLQGPVQYLFPHEVMICGVGVPGSDALRFDSFSSIRYFTDQHAEEATTFETGLIARTLEAWRVHKRPVMLGGDRSKGDYGGFVVPFDGVDETLHRLELRNLAAHGMWGNDGDVSTFFCFSRMPGAVDSRHAYILELVIPHLHSALLRFVQTTSEGGARLQRTRTNGDHQVTSREQEVLQWINNGKTNWEIAQILDISPLTVKNHVQNILRKLEVQNRRHAGLKAVKIGLIKD